LASKHKAPPPGDMTDPASWTREMRAIARPLASVKPYPRNTRTHPPAQIELLASLLRKFGPDQPIVVDEGGVILKGHGREEAARTAGMASFPVVERRGLSEEDKAALRIADNQVALLSGWDASRDRAAEGRRLRAEPARIRRCAAGPVHDHAGPAGRRFPAVRRGHRRRASVPEVPLSVVGELRAIAGAGA
jgi:hypothetical protein